MWCLPFCLCMTVPRFFVFEWIHGAGKSTLVTSCTQHLIASWYAVKSFIFPDKTTDLGRTIRSLITDHRVVGEWRIVWSLYAAFANWFHACIDDGKTIWLCDRHSVTSGLIFQDDIPASVREELYWPSLTALRDAGQIIFCDCDDAVAQQRWQERNKTLLDGDEFEKNKARDAFFAHHHELTTKMRQSFLPQCMARGLPVFKIDCSADIATNTHTICSFIISNLASS